MNISNSSSAAVGPQIPLTNPTGEAETVSAGVFERQAGAIRLVSIAAILGGLLMVVRTLPITDGVQWLEGWLAQMGVWGPIAFAGIYIAATLLFIPGFLLTLAGGALFGLVGGLLAVSLASTTSAAIAFLIGRYLARDAVRQQTAKYRTFGAVDRAIAEGGWKIVFMLRLVPVFPFSMGNYLLGLTPVKFGSYVAASWLGMLPGTFVYVFFGHAGRKTVEAAASGTKQSMEPLEWVLMVLGGLVAVGLTVYLARLVSGKLKEQTNIDARDTEKAPSKSPQHEGPHTEAHPFRPLRLAALTMVAGLMLLAGACATLVPDWLTRMFGPPAVTMIESYAGSEDSTDFDHATFDQVLRRYLNANGGVDYQGLMEHPRDLLAYNRSPADAPWERLGRDEKLALLINPYNSFTFQLMIEWLPREGIEAIQDIPGADRWYQGDLTQTEGRVL